MEAEVGPDGTLSGGAHTTPTGLPYRARDGRPAADLGVRLRAGQWGLQGPDTALGELQRQVLDPQAKLCSNASGHRHRPWVCRSVDPLTPPPPQMVLDFSSASGGPFDRLPGPVARVWAWDWRAMEGRKPRHRLPCGCHPSPHRVHQQGQS